MRIIRKVLPTITLLLVLGTGLLYGADSFQASLKAGERFHGNKEYAAAVRAFDVAGSQAANDTERGLALGKKAELYAFDLKDYVSARHAADQVLGLKSAAPVARVIGLQVLAQCQIKADKDYTAASRALEEASKLEGVAWAQPSIALMLGDCYRMNGRPSEAVSTYRRVSQMPSASNGVRAIAYLNTGLTYQYNLHRPDRAKSFYAKAVELDAQLQEETSKHLRETPPERLILAHYMPWYTAKPPRERWGWHWTMNHFDPEKVTDGRREIASEFYPLIGAYDSGDPHVIEYHLLLMKLSGIDGVIVDWYGIQPFRDYPILHRNTQRLVEQVERLGMKLVICYEDQTISALVSASRLAANEKAAHAAREIQWLAENWFGLNSYVRLDDRPVLLSFGNAGLSSDEWTQCLQRLKSPVAYFSEHVPRQAASGAFDWPIPEQGISQIERFNNLSRNWPDAIPVAFPRFIDIYAKAQVNDGYTRIEDDGGMTFQSTIDHAFAANSRLIQIATWNDWGEGTQIEPSKEFGYRDLEVLQKSRRNHVDASFKPQSADLRIPYQLWRLRRAVQQDTNQLDDIAESIATGDLQKARSEIKSLSQR